MTGGGDSDELEDVAGEDDALDGDDFLDEDDVGEDDTVDPDAVDDDPTAGASDVGGRAGEPNGDSTT